jgi:hypothetical protein
MVVLGADLTYTGFDRAEHAATALVDGQILVTGGIAGSQWFRLKGQPRVLPCEPE